MVYEDAKAKAVTQDGYKVYCSYDEIVDIGILKENPQNPNKHPQAQIDMLAKIIETNGWRAPITVSKRSGYIVRGHARKQACEKLGSGYVPVDYQDYDSDEAELADLVADNRIAELAVLDEKQVRDILQQLNDEQYDIDLSGYTSEQLQEMLDTMAEESDEAEKRSEARKSLADRFVVSPFSVLDARSAAWNNRKAAWKNIGIKSEIGRGNDDVTTNGGLTFANSAQPVSTYKAKEAYEKKIGQKISWDDFALLFPDEFTQSGTSIFDPVLCEVMYRWFCPVGGAIIDPFAGGSVRGIVAAMLGRKYTGVDLSERQIEANINNWSEMDKNDDIPAPKWICGDSMNIDTLTDGEYDMLFTCPPYADLEKYSDKKEDISNMEYPEFLKVYREIVYKATAKLKSNRFAAVVVGEVRGKDGNYYNFVSDTVRAFIDAGLSYYNEAVLITPYGSLAVRAGGVFKKSRKLGKTHQNILVFLKGDAKKANEEIGNVEIPETEMSEINELLGI